MELKEGVTEVTGKLAVVLQLTEYQSLYESSCNVGLNSVPSFFSRANEFTKRQYVSFLSHSSLPLLCVRSPQSFLRFSIESLVLLAPHQKSTQSNSCKHDPNAQYHGIQPSLFPTRGLVYEIPDDSMTYCDPANKQTKIAR